MVCTCRSTGADELASYLQELRARSSPGLPGDDTQRGAKKQTEMFHCVTPFYRNVIVMWFEIEEVRLLIFKRMSWHEQSTDEIRRDILIDCMRALLWSRGETHPRKNIVRAALSKGY